MLIIAGIGIVLFLAGNATRKIPLMVIGFWFAILGFVGKLYFWVLNETNLMEGSGEFFLMMTGGICILAGIFLGRKRFIYLGALSCALGLLWAIGSQITGPVS